MNKTFVISDLHLDHKRILDFSPNRGGSNVKEHNEWIVSQWNSVVHKRDIVYVLGDVVFSKDALSYLSKMHGQKMLVRGNHDKLSTETYLQYFTNVYGILLKNGFWLTHCPIHPLELRGRKNIHGHVHHNTIPDENYINACVEACNGVPIDMADLMEEGIVVSEED